jgi:hypothetical protein
MRPRSAVVACFGTLANLLGANLGFRVLNCRLIQAKSSRFANSSIPRVALTKSIAACSRVTTKHPLLCPPWPACTSSRFDCVNVGLLTDSSRLLKCLESIDEQLVCFSLWGKSQHLPIVVKQRCAACPATARRSLSACERIRRPWLMGTNISGQGIGAFHHGLSCSMFGHDAPWNFPL